MMCQVCNLVDRQLHCTTATVATVTYNAEEIHKRLFVMVTTACND